MASPWTNDPYAQAKLTKEQVELYLERIALPKDLVDSPPSLDLLTTLMVSHLEHVAKDTSPLHVPEEQWDGPSTPIKLSSAFTNMPESTGAFDRVVRQRKGAFCFAINATFAALLRSFGFRVSELVGRAFKSLGNDPTVHEDGWRWGTLTHELLVADWEGAAGRWLVDGAWGPWSCSVPIKLESGAQTLGLNPYEAFEVRHEVLPLDAAAAQPIDSLAGWTLYRFIPPPDTPLSLPLTGSTTGHFSPQFHFHPLSIPTTDFQLYHHFSVSHELASFTAFFLVTKLIPGTGGARRSLMYADKPGEGRRAKVYTTGGTEGRGSLQGRDVEWVEMETGPMKEYLRQEFGFGFT